MIASTVAIANEEGAELDQSSQVDYSTDNPCLEASSTDSMTKCLSRLHCSLFTTGFKNTRGDWTV